MAETLTATLQTSQGRVVLRLFPDHAPKTVRNFVELAEGGREWTDPGTGRPTTAKLYDGTIFHRVIPARTRARSPPATGTLAGRPTSRACAAAGRPAPIACARRPSASSASSAS